MQETVSAGEAAAPQSDFRGRTVLITGAGSGIGRAMAFRFAGLGASVAVVDVNAEAAQQVSDEIGRGGGTTAPWQADVRDADTTDGVFRGIESRFGPVDVLVNNAAIRDLSPCLDLPLAEWSAVLDINLTGAFLYAQAAAKSMRRGGRGGVLLSIASVAGLTALPNRIAYVSSKHALIGLTRALAWELGAYGIRANAIAPGGVETPMAAEVFRRFPEKAEAIRKSCPAGRLAQAEEIADLAVFLASDRARFINGAILPIDGGFTAGKDL